MKHPMIEELRAIGSVVQPKTPAAKKPVEPVLDAADTGASDAAISDIRTAAVGAAQQWCETKPADLGDGETMADRLTALLIGIADENKDGDLSEDEMAVIEVAMDAATSYMVSKGATEDDAAAVVYEGDNDAAMRVQELLKDTMPEGDDAASEEIDGFVFDGEAKESVLDGVDAILDAVYKKRTVIRGGKKVRINKRISGHVRLSGAQKVAIRKARMKSHSAAARVRRMKSMKIRQRTGLK